jgi:hypothetical protein
MIEVTSEVTSEGESHSMKEKRSKRGKYVGCACFECKRRKIKCNGVTPCERCSNLKLSCVYPSRETHRIRRRKKLRKDTGDDNKLKSYELELPIMNEVKEENGLSPDAKFEPITAHQLVHPETAASNHDKQTAHIVIPHDVSHNLFENAPLYMSETDNTEASTDFNIPPHQRRLSISDLAHVLFVEGGGEEKFAESVFADEMEEKHLCGLSYLDVQRFIEVYECEVNCMYPMFPMGELMSKLDAIYEHYSVGRVVRPEDEEDLMHIKIAIAIGASVSGIHTKSGKMLYEGFVAQVEQGQFSQCASVKRVLNLLLVHEYQFLSDMGTLAYRSLGSASMLSLELGMHRTDELETMFPDPAEQEHARMIFWCMYVMDRLSSIYTRRPFIFHDSDIDQKLPQCFASGQMDSRFPDDDIFRAMHLNYMIRYSQLAGKVLEALGTDKQGNGGLPENLQYLLYLMENWRASLPSDLRPKEKSCEEDDEEIEPPSTPRGSQKLRSIIWLRPSLIILHVYKSCNIEAYLEPAINTACGCIRELGRLYFNTTFYSSCETQYNHVLVSALEVMYSCLLHAPQYSKRCMGEIRLALKIISLIMKSSNNERRQGNIWQLLVSFAFKFGLYSPFEGRIRDSEDYNVSVNREVMIMSLISELGTGLENPDPIFVETGKITSVSPSVVSTDPSPAGDKSAG